MAAADRDVHEVFVIYSTGRQPDIVGSGQPISGSFVIVTTIVSPHPRAARRRKDKEFLKHYRSLSCVPDTREPSDA